MFEAVRTKPTSFCTIDCEPDTNAGDDIICYIPSFIIEVLAVQIIIIQISHKHISSIQHYLNKR